MASRWLQSKYIKIAAERRRAHLKRPRFAGVDVPKIIVNDMFNNRQRVRTNVTSPSSEDHGLPILNNTFMRDVPRSLYELYRKRRAITHWEPDEIEFAKFVSEHLKTHPQDKLHGARVWKAWLAHPKDGVNEAQLKLLRERRELEEQHVLLDTLYGVWQGKWKHGVKRYTATKLEGAGNYSLMLYFAGNEWIFVQEADGTRAISKTYYGREEAMRRYDENKNGTGQGIKWIRFDKLK